MRKGFSLAEIVIAITVLTVTVVSVTSLILSSLNVNKQNINQIIAYSLAQEGVEIMRNIRDSNWLQNQFWSKGGFLWGSEFENGGRFIVDYKEPIVSADIANVSTTEAVPWILSEISANEEEKTRLYYQDIGDLRKYTHEEISAGGTNLESPFRREILVEPVNVEGEELIVKVRVTSTVYYESRGNEKSVEIITDLTDWKRGAR